MTELSRLSAVIPAAGLSSRMGAFKPLLPFGGVTVAEASVGNALAAADKAVVVLGNRSQELRELLCSRFGDRLIFAENPDYASADMFASVKLGVRALPDCAAFFIAPADMPMIPPAVFRALSQAFDPERDEIIIPVVGGRRGHPPLISSRLIPDILACDGSDGLRGFFRGRTVTKLAVTGCGVLTDLDTPADYERALSDLRRFCASE